MVCSKAKDEGGLPPVKDDNAAARHFIRRTLTIFNRGDYAVSLAATPPCSPYIRYGGTEKKISLPLINQQKGHKKMPTEKGGPPNSTPVGA